jgi:hypothetical protein
MRKEEVLSSTKHARDDAQQTPKTRMIVVVMTKKEQSLVPGVLQR